MILLCLKLRVLSPSAPDSQRDLKRQLLIMPARHAHSRHEPGPRRKPPAVSRVAAIWYRHGISSVLLLCFVCTLGKTALAAGGFDVFRGLQYDVGEDALGTRDAALGLKAALNPGLVDLPPRNDDMNGDDDHGQAASSADDGPSKGRRRRRRRARLPMMNRNIVVVDMADASRTLLEQLLDERKVGGLLLILPKDMTRISSKDRTDWQKLEQWLLQREIKAPVYFAVESSAIDELRKDLSLLNGSSDSLLLKLESGAVKPATLKKPLSPSLVDIQGWLPTFSDSAESEHLPTIALVAHYDAFGFIPDMSKGGGSGTVALLELARLFSQLYSSTLSSSAATHNLLFVMTSGGSTNFAGSREWLDVVDVQLIDSIDFVLCLDDLDVGEGDFFVHFSKNPEKDETIRKVLRALDAAAKGLGDGTRMVHKRKRINLMDSNLAWEHEQFAMKRMVAATVSGRETAPKLFQRSSSFDVASASNTARQHRLKQAVHLIAEALAMIVYPALKVEDEGDAGGSKAENGFVHQIFTGELGVDGNYIDVWTDYMGSVPRLVSAMGFSDNKVASSLEGALNAHVSKTEMYDFVLDKSEATPFAFYGASKGFARAVMVKGVTYDLCMTLVVFTYLIALWGYISIEVDGYRGFRQRIPYVLRRFLPKSSVN